MGSEQGDSMMHGQAAVWQFMLSLADSMTVKSAVELRIADIINSHDGPISLPQIASSIDGSVSPDMTCLARIMRFLVRRKFFTAHVSEDRETLYGLTDSSRWLLRDSEITLAPLFLMNTHPWLLAPWHYFSQCVREGGIAFKKAHGVNIFEFASENSKFNKLFNDGMACTTKSVTRELLSEYKDGFNSIGSLVNVGGGTGGLLAEIVKAYPHIKGTNFDLPHVVETAPMYQGVCHVGGDMFEAIPKADAVIIKSVMHDWSDEDCIKILKKCKDAIPEKTGKLILVEIVMQSDGNGVFDDMIMTFDLLMMAHCSGGREREEHEYKKLVKEGGFSRCNFIKIPCLLSIIEAFP